MKRLLACLALCASLSAFAQDDCDLFNIHELASENQELRDSIAEMSVETVLLQSENQELRDSIAEMSVETVLLQSDGSYEVLLSNGNASQLVLGCMDSNFTEFEASANTDDGSCVTPVVEGCTDSDYIEYYAEANTDDGSCSTDVVEGCTDPAYLEYNASANTDDGSCATPVVEGCTDSDYTEYDASANTDDGSCVTAVVNGCTDANYIEYNAAANTDDGSCATLIVNGCTDPAYTEYDASANTDDGSCATQVVPGCTNPTDINYNAAANTDDGSCLTLASSCSEVWMDGYTYSVVEIGDQCWFAENLRTTLYADDSDIPEVTGNAAWTGLSTAARCDYDNNANNVATYGRIYNWYAVNNGSGLCPSGWHVPTDGEWTELEEYLGLNGHSGAEGTALKSTSGWLYGGNGTDDFGFSAFPSGQRSNNHGDTYSAGYICSWWTSSPSDFERAWAWGADSFATEIYHSGFNWRRGLSVRCLRDAD